MDRKYVKVHFWGESLSTKFVLMHKEVVVVIGVDFQSHQGIHFHLS